MLYRMCSLFLSNILPDWLSLSLSLYTLYISSCVYSWRCHRTVPVYRCRSRCSLKVTYLGFLYSFSQLEKTKNTSAQVRTSGIMLVLRVILVLH